MHCAVPRFVSFCFVSFGFAGSFVNTISHTSNPLSQMALCRGILGGVGFVLGSQLCPVQGLVLFRV
jgi:hypothetical protein